MSYICFPADEERSLHTKRRGGEGTALNTNPGIPGTSDSLPGQRCNERRVPGEGSGTARLTGASRGEGRRQEGAGSRISAHPVRSLRRSSGTPRSRRSRAVPPSERPAGPRARPRPRQRRARAAPRSPGPARRCRRSPDGGSTAPRSGGGGGRRGIRGPAAPPAAGGRRRRPAGSDGSAARPGPARGAHPTLAPRGPAAAAPPGGESQAPADTPSRPVPVRCGASPARSRAGPRRWRPPAPLPP